MNPYLECLSDELLSDLVYAVIKKRYLDNSAIASFLDMVCSEVISYVGIFAWYDSNYPFKVWQILDEVTTQKDPEDLYNYKYSLHTDASGGYYIIEIYKNESVKTIKVI